MKQRLGSGFLAAGSVSSLSPMPSPPLPFTPLVENWEKDEIQTGDMGLNLTSPLPRCIVLETFLNLFVFLPSFLFSQKIFTEHPLRTNTYHMC